MKVTYGAPRPLEPGRIGIGLGHLSKNAKAIKELTDKGMAPS